MSKSMLVIDTPRCCSQCNFFGYFADYDYACFAMNGCKAIFEDDDLDYIDIKRHKQCPLQPYNFEVDCNIAAEGLTEMVKEWDRGE